MARLGIDATPTFMDGDRDRAAPGPRFRASSFSPLPLVACGCAQR